MSPRSASRSTSSPASAISTAHEDLIRQSLQPECRLAGLHAARRADHAEAPFRRSLLYAQAVRSLFHERRAADRRTCRARSIARSSTVAPDYDVVIATDFGHGLIAPSSIDALTSKCALPGGEHPEQQRQSRLQSDHQISAAPTTSASTRRRRGSRSATASRRRRHRAPAGREPRRLLARSSSPRASTAASPSSAAASSTPFRLSPKTWSIRSAPAMHSLR